jgi:acetylornithine deacetylase/succinyl-diaminopimelate desuccinylase-like protein
MASLSAVDILAELIAIPSVNPHLAATADGRSGESSLTEWLCQFCDRQGWRWTTQQVHPGRSNVIALAPGQGDGVLLWEAHQDTVSSIGMTVEPFTAAVRDGRVYGRGACDVKGGLAVLLAALLRLASDPSPLRPTILFCSTVNEECGFTGARALASIWDDRTTTTFDPAAFAQHRGALDVRELTALRPQAALIAEPTGMNVVVAHRGVIRWRATVHGLAAHSSRPEQGRNAIYAMMNVVRAVDEFHRTDLANRPADPMCGPSTAVVTTIHGGNGPNTIPDQVVIDVDRRLAPGESPEAAYHEVVARLEEATDLNGCRLAHDAPWMQSPGLAAGSNLAWADQVAKAARAAGAPGRVLGVPYGTNAASVAAAGIPAVVFGPGSIEQAHTADEWIAVEQLERCVDALCRLARGFDPRNT